MKIFNIKGNNLEKSGGKETLSRLILSAFYVKTTA